MAGRMEISCKGRLLITSVPRTNEMKIHSSLSHTMNHLCQRQNFAPEPRILLFVLAQYGLQNLVLLLQLDFVVLNCEPVCRLCFP
jgi:hypothetical protein